jgi:cytochrome c oxidase assembly factor CtaG
VTAVSTVVAHLVAPSPPTVGRIATDWQPDVLLAVPAVAGTLYLLGVRRLTARDRAWPVSRTVAFLLGLAVIVVATQSGLAAYDRVLFSLHVVQHLLLGMLAPLLLALGAPVTLGLQAGSRTTQQRTLRALHSAPARVITHPVIAWLVFGGTLFVLYFTGLYELSLRNELVHVALHAHLLVTGSLFMWHVVALDPIPTALGYGARMLFVLIALPFHAFLGVAILSSNRVLAAGWYNDVVRRWGPSPLTDQRTGGGILWAAGEVLGLAAAAVILYRWMSAEDRAAARHDRRTFDRVVAAGDR